MIRLLTARWFLPLSLSLGGLACGGDPQGGADSSDGSDAAGGDATGGPPGSGGALGSGGGGFASGGSQSAGGTLGTGGTDGDAGLAPISCDDYLEIRYADSGLPLLELNPGAPVTLYLDFDGGTYASSSGDQHYGAYNRDDSDSADTFDLQEQADIIQSAVFVDRYYAMFDVNVTTDDAVRSASEAWGWIVITEGYSGGRASTASSAIGQNPKARAVCGANTVRDDDKSRRIAHELGHNFTLDHSGVWDGGEFYKWEDWSGWDHVYGPIMGGGGEGDRNGWANGLYSDGDPTDPSDTQDEISIIRERLRAVGSATGWRKDDFPDATVAPLCQGENSLYRKGILGSSDDEDHFALLWDGGDVTLEAIIPTVSAALLEVDLLDDDVVVLSATNTSNATASATGPLDAGQYRVRVRSRGGYGELGAYEVRIR